MTRVYDALNTIKDALLMVNIKEHILAVRPVHIKTGHIFFFDYNHSTWVEHPAPRDVGFVDNLIYDAIRKQHMVRICSFDSNTWPDIILTVNLCA
jgi:hypothetical protein